jgi:putative membrane protein
MRPFLHLAVVGVAMTFGPVHAQDVKPKPAADASPIMTIDKATFLTVVASANEFEIQSSELAKQKAGDGQLKEVADMIIADHKKAGAKLKSLLEAKNETPPPAKLAPKHRKMLDQLESAKGKEFDLLYIDLQAQAHMEAVALFRAFAGTGDDQTLVGFAKETLPRLETHLGHVKMLVLARHQP